MATGWGGVQGSYDHTSQGSSPLMSRMKGRAGWEKAPVQAGPEVDPSRVWGSDPTPAPP